MLIRKHLELTTAFNSLSDFTTAEASSRLLAPMNASDLARPPSRWPGGQGHAVRPNGSAEDTGIGRSAGLQGQTAGALIAGLNEGLRLLEKTAPIPASADDAAVWEGLPPLGPAARERIAALIKGTAAVRMLRSPFYANLTAQAEELDRTFAMLADEMSVAVLQWLIKFRLRCRSMRRGC